jgi:hypothetical protein
VKADGEGFFVGKIRPIDPARMIAKIAYSYAVGELGYGSFRPLVTDLILGKTETLSYWVGGEWEIPPPTNTAFDLGWNKHVRDATGVEYVVVSVRLFSFFETPIYHVVVGDVPKAAVQA